MKIQGRPELSTMADQLTAGPWNLYAYLCNGKLNRPTLELLAHRLLHIRKAPIMAGVYPTHHHLHPSHSFPLVNPFSSSLFVTLWPITSHHSKIAQGGYLMDSVPEDLEVAFLHPSEAYHEQQSHW